ncbi:MAG: hypothetical protein BroJett024_00440 [Alphaproteobacteria bacterium]|nr:MAG: hypothetical protein BroJett024_00440 [Alphaproteobacteria bacterium]
MSGETGNLHLIDWLIDWLHSIDWRFVITITIPALVIVIGWFLTHWLNSRRDLTLRKREARLKSLESAYMRIATSSNRPLDKIIIENIEAFVSEIQLYGTPRQIELMTILVEEFKKPNNYVSYDALLRDLRDSIRKELNLEPISGEVWWLRIDGTSHNRIDSSAKD